MIYETKKHSKPNLATAVVNFTILAAIFKILTPLKLEDFCSLAKMLPLDPMELRKKFGAFVIRVTINPLTDSTIITKIITVVFM